jgi:hypothetical protein
MSSQQLVLRRDSMVTGLSHDLQRCRTLHQTTELNELTIDRGQAKVFICPAKLKHLDLKTG